MFIQDFWLCMISDDIEADELNDLFGVDFSESMPMSPKNLKEIMTMLESESGSNASPQDPMVNSSNEQKYQVKPLCWYLQSQYYGDPSMFTARKGIIY